MNNSPHDRRFALLSGLSCIFGVILLVVSFSINPGPPAGATGAELVRFGHEHYAEILWEAWLQAVGPVFIVLFAFALVQLAGGEPASGLDDSFWSHRSHDGESHRGDLLRRRLVGRSSHAAVHQHETDLCRSAPLLCCGRARALFAARDCDCRLTRTPKNVWLSGVCDCRCFRCGGNRLSSHSQTVRRSHRTRRHSAALVAGCGRYADGPKWKNPPTRAELLV